VPIRSASANFSPVRWSRSSRRTSSPAAESALGRLLGDLLGGVLAGVGDFDDIEQQERVEQLAEP